MLKLLRLITLITLLLSISTTLHATDSQTCTQLVQNFVAHDAFNPIKILKAHNLDPRDIQFDVELVKEQGIWGPPVGSQGMLRFNYKGQESGVIYIDDFPFGNNRVCPFSLEALSIDSLKGKGLGTIMYLILARTLWNQKRLRLASDNYTAVSEEARALWKRLEQRGFAIMEEQSNGMKYWVITDKIEENYHWKYLDEFIESSTKIDHVDPEALQDYI
jgi:hypothetical protein